MNTSDEIFFDRTLLNEQAEDASEKTESRTSDVFIERPFSTNPDTHPVNGNYTPEDEDEEESEDDLILGDEDEVTGDEEEFDVELEEDIDEADIDEDDLVIDADDEIDEDDDL